MAIERDLRQSGRTASVDRTSIRPTRVSRLILGLAIIYVSAGSSPNVSLTAKPRVILMPNRSLPASERSIPSQVKRDRFSSGPSQASVRRFGPVTWNGLGSELSSGPLRPDHGKRVEPPAERAGRRQRQPVLEHGGVDPPEVDGHLQVVVLEVEKARGRTDQTGPHMLPDKEDGPGRAVVRAGRAVLVHSPPELAEAQDQHAVRQAGRIQVLLESPQRLGKFQEQAGVRSKLTVVRVVAALLGVIDSRRAPDLMSRAMSDSRPPRSVPDSSSSRPPARIISATPSAAV